MSSTTPLPEPFGWITDQGGHGGTFFQRHEPTGLAALTASTMPVYSASQIASLREKLAAAEADAKRLDWLEKQCRGASDSERYLPFRIYWGDGRGIRAAIDAHLERGEG